MIALSKKKNTMHTNIGKIRQEGRRRWRREKKKSQKTLLCSDSEMLQKFVKYALIWTIFHDLYSHNEKYSTMLALLILWLLQEEDANEEKMNRKTEILRKTKKFATKEDEHK